MALNSASLDRAAVTRCYEVDIIRGGVEVVKALPWVFVRPGDADDDALYVAPATAVGTTVPGAALLPQPPLYMRDKPFPHDLDRPAISAASGNLAVPGPLAVNFFGGI